MKIGTTSDELQLSNQVMAELKSLLAKHSDKRVVVVGTTCTGKSTMLTALRQGRDQDAEVFPKLTAAESAYVCQSPWTQEIGETMARLVRERVRSEIGSPLFGTVVVDADLVVLLKISDALLGERAASRNVKFEDAKNMQEQIQQEVLTSGVPWVEFSVG